MLTEIRFAAQQAERVHPDELRVHDDEFEGVQRLPLRRCALARARQEVRTDRAPRVDKESARPLQDGQLARAPQAQTRHTDRRPHPLPLNEEQVCSSSDSDAKLQSRGDGRAEAASVSDQLFDIT